MATVGGLISYPVKGCAGVPARVSPLTRAGLAHDRSFMVTDPSGGFRSQRRDPRLAVIRPAVEADGTRLALSAPGVADLHLDVDLDAARRDVVLFGAPYRGIDQGERAAEWLSRVLAVPSRLVRVPPDHDRVTDGRTPGTSGYADSSPVHAISQASLDELNRRLGASSLPMSRFRPNIVIDGWDEPHLEDLIGHVRIGDTELGFAKRAIRCAVTMVDQRTGTKAGPEPLRTLATYRRAAEGGIAFGVKLSVLRPGRLAVGDALVASDP
ncbi:MULTISPECIES: MOSC domain-containing protein [Nonomuraea]|uniref:MOSC domain-containing protein n=1 Tax=Nonomuraea mangrovi TaxID=2316207 RepID=A0ABW4T598_9ACTN